MSLIFTLLFVVLIFGALAYGFSLAPLAQPWKWLLMMILLIFFIAILLNLLGVWALP